MCKEPQQDSKNVHLQYHITTLGGKRAGGNETRQLYSKFSSFSTVYLPLTLIIYIYPILNCNRNAPPSLLLVFSTHVKRIKENNFLQVIHKVVPSADTDGFESLNSGLSGLFPWAITRSNQHYTIIIILYAVLCFLCNSDHCSVIIITYSFSIFKQLIFFIRSYCVVQLQPGECLHDFGAVFKLCGYTLTVQ